MGVKVFSRIIRLRHVLRALERVSSERCRVDWARLAVDEGYFDQAHFVRDFRALTGLTPERFLATGLMSHVQESGIQMFRRPSREGLDFASAVGYGGTLSPDGD